jgi:hypothetical protein
MLAQTASREFSGACSYFCPMAPAKLQAEVQRGILRTSEGPRSAVFVSEYIPPWYYVELENIRQDASETFDGPLPEGFHPDEKTRSLVLENAELVKKMLDASFSISLYVVNKVYPHTYAHGGMLAPQSGSLLDRYADRLRIINIPRVLFDMTKGIVPYAAYRWPGKQAVILAHPELALPGPVTEPCLDKLCGPPTLDAWSHHRATLLLDKDAKPYVSGLLRLLYATAADLVPEPIGAKAPEGERPLLKVRNTLRGLRDFRFR